MNEMPVGCVAIFTGILAHRRNANAVCEDGVAQAKPAEQMRHVITFRYPGLEWARGLLQSGAAFPSMATVGIRAALFKHILWLEDAEGLP
jgi:hypothetical protein